MKASDSQRLANEYRALVTGLADQGLLRGSAADQILANPLLPDDIMQVRFRWPINGRLRVARDCW